MSTHGRPKGELTAAHGAKVLSMLTHGRPKGELTAAHGAKVSQ